MLGAGVELADTRPVLRGVVSSLWVAAAVATALSPTTARATGEDRHANDSFGAALAVDGERLRVGAPGANSVAFNAGAVWVYEPGRDGPVDRIVPRDAPAHGRLGGALALDGDRLLVATGMDIAQGPWRRQRAWIFRRKGARWVEEAELSREDPESLSDMFGLAVALSGGRAAISTMRTQVGNAYVDADVDVFELVDGVWARRARLPGWSSRLVLVGDTLWLEGGSTWRVFQARGGSWTEVPSEISGDVIAVPGTPARVAVVDGETLSVIRVEEPWTIEATVALPGDSYGGSRLLAASSGQIAVGRRGGVGGQWVSARDHDVPGRGGPVARRRGGSGRAG